MGKVRQAFKPQVEVDSGRFLMFVLYQVAGFVQPFVLQPVTGRSAESFLKVAFKTGQAAPGELCKFFDRHVEPVIAEHKLFQVYLVRLAKIKQKIF